MSHLGAQLIRAAFDEVLAQGTMTFQNYFTSDYHQWSDGEELDAGEFREHIEALIRRLRTGWRFEDFIIDEEVAEGNKVVTRHRLVGRNAEGKEFTVRVLALFEVTNGRLGRCWELSRTEGAADHENLASTRT
jgi:hypothetical protein